MESIPENIREKAEAFAFRQLIAHLREHPEVQNMELMTISGFCRNCLSKWLLAGYREQAPLPLTDPLTYDTVSTSIYGMPTAEWKKAHQTKATKAQMDRYEASKIIHAKHDASVAQSNVPTSLSSAPLSELTTEKQFDPCCPVSTAPVGVGQATVALPAAPPPPPPVSIKVGVLTVSDRVTRGVYSDESGPMAIGCLEEFALRFPQVSLQIVRQAAVPDEQEDIKRILREWSLGEAGGTSTEPPCTLIITTGGTGLSERDVTPEATICVAERLLPSLALEITSMTAELEPMAFLSRGVCGVVGKTLIVNVPGSPGAVKQYLDVGLTLLVHSSAALAGT